MKFNQIPTPAYICEESKLNNNLKILNEISIKSGAKVLCALKGFAFSPAMLNCANALAGATCSGLNEAKYARSFGFKSVHTYSPAFKDSEINEIIALSDHIIFNSLNQLRAFGKKAKNAGVSIGLRLNPQSSASPCDAYNPCARYSRLGVSAKMLQNATNDDLDLLDGLHFHALCEQNSKALELVLNAFKANFNALIERKNIKWLNFGGGHHISKQGYDKELLISLINEYSSDFSVYLEPGEAVGWQCGYLLASVLDVVDNEIPTYIIDASAQCHMPDTALMPYRPALRGEILNKNEQKNAHKCRFGGATCLAGDVVGLEAGEPDFYIKEPLKIGDKVIFEDQIHYSVVKNTTFNGVALPALVWYKDNGEYELKRIFDYEDFARRN